MTFIIPNEIKKLVNREEQDKKVLRKFFEKYVTRNSILDKKEQDVLHYIEFNDPSEEEYVQLIACIQEVRKNRRIIKKSLSIIRKLMERNVSRARMILEDNETDCGTYTPKMVNNLFDINEYKLF